MPPGAAPFRPHALAQWATDATQRRASGLARFQQRLEAWAALDARVATDAAPRAPVAPTPPVGQRRLTMPGLGERTATALVAAVSEAAQCTKGRQFAAWRGLVPRQHSPGGQGRLGGISTHGDRSRRPWWVQGARRWRRWGGRKRDRRRQWGQARLERRGWHRAAVAWATQHARVAGGRLGTAQVEQGAAASAAHHVPERTKAPHPRHPAARCPGRGVRRG